VNDEPFDRFWNVYPRKTAKVLARKAFAKAIVKTTLDKMLFALSWQARTEQWMRGVIPHPATWLNGERWDDEPPVPPRATPAVAPTLPASHEAIDRAVAIAARRDELLREGKTRAEASLILEREADERAK